MQHTDTPARQRIGLLGGTFDPIHDGHLALAQLFAEQLALDTLILMPAGQQPQKQHISPAEHRLAMVRLAAQAMAPQFAAAKLATEVVVDTQEIERAGPSYTVDTLRTLRAQVGPAASLSLLIGGDQLVRLDTWHAWQALFESAHVCAATRPGIDWQAASPAVRDEIARRAAPVDTIKSTPGGHILLNDSLALDISATDLRARLASRTGPRPEVPDTVRHYIETHHLYQT